MTETEVLKKSKTSIFKGDESIFVNQDQTLRQMSMQLLIDGMAKNIPTGVIKEYNIADQAVTEQKLDKKIIRCITDLEEDKVPKGLLIKEQDIAGRWLEKYNVRNNNITPNENNFLIQNCELKNGSINLDERTHGVVKNISKYGVGRVGSVVNITGEGWRGAYFLENIFALNSEYGIRQIPSKSTITVLSNSCFENVRVPIETNGKIKVNNIYAGDNSGDVDENNHDCIIRALENANVQVRDSELGVGCREYASSENLTYAIEMNGSDELPCIVQVKDSIITVHNQFEDAVKTGAIFKSLSKNNVLFLDNVYFIPSKNEQHAVKPFLLQEYACLRSHTPMTSYLVGGLFNNDRLIKYCNGSNYSYVNKVPGNEYYNLVNAYGGNIIEFTRWSLVIPYSIPEYLVGTQMSLIVDVANLSSGTIYPSILYAQSDCKEAEIETYSKQFYKTRYSKIIPYRHFVQFTPNKTKGVVKIYHNTEDNISMTVANVMLVESAFMHILGTYNEYDTKEYTIAKPTKVGEEGELVFSLYDNGHNGWQYVNGEWKDISI